MSTLPPAAHFFARVNKNGPVHPKCGQCWEYVDSKKANRYGRVMISYRRMRAHRWSWTIHRGTIPANMQVLHKCDNPRCVNPDHLFLGTQLENVRDMEAKGRGRKVKGQDHPASKLTLTQVRRIKRLYVRGCRHFGTPALARRFGVSQPVIYGIIYGTGWRHT